MLHFRKYLKRCYLYTKTRPYCIQVSCFIEEDITRPVFLLPRVGSPNLSMDFDWVTGEDVQ